MIGRAVLKLGVVYCITHEHHFILANNVMCLFICKHFILLLTFIEVLLFHL